jgi:hypothetical protein
MMASARVSVSLLSLVTATACAGCRSPSAAPAPTAITSASAPVTVAAPRATVTDVCVGDRHSCLLDSAGVVACFGDNGAGRFRTPHRMDGIPVAKRLRCSSGGACVSTAGNDVVCFGEGRESAQTVTLPAHAADFRIWPGGGCALLNDRRVACWQANPLAAPAALLVEQAAPATSIAVVASSTDRICATTTTGAPVCWNTFMGHRVPQGVTPPPYKGPEVRGLERLDAFAGATELVLAPRPCARFADGRTTCTPPLPVPWKATSTAEFLATNGELSCLRGGDGKVDCGEAILRLPGEPVPAVIAGVPRDAARLALGKEHGCAVVSGALECWGRGDSGQLGDGSASAEERAPVHVAWP